MSTDEGAVMEEKDVEAEQTEKFKQLDGGNDDGNVNASSLEEVAKAGELVPETLDTDDKAVIKEDSKDQEDTTETDHEAVVSNGDVETEKEEQARSDDKVDGDEPLSAVRESASVSNDVETETHSKTEMISTEEQKEAANPEGTAEEEEVASAVAESAGVSNDVVETEKYSETEVISSEEREEVQQPQGAAEERELEQPFSSAPENISVANDDVETEKHGEIGVISSEEREEVEQPQETAEEREPVSAVPESASVSNDDVETEKHGETEVISSEEREEVQQPEGTVEERELQQPESAASESPSVSNDDVETEKHGEAEGTVEVGELDQPVSSAAQSASVSIHDAETEKRGEAEAISSEEQNGVQQPEDTVDELEQEKTEEEQKQDIGQKHEETAKDVKVEEAGGEKHSTPAPKEQDAETMEGQMQPATTAGEEHAPSNEEERFQPAETVAEDHLHEEIKALGDAQQNETVEKPADMTKQLKPKETDDDPTAPMTEKPSEENEKSPKIATNLENGNDVMVHPDPEQTLEAAPEIPKPCPAPEPDPAHQSILRQQLSAGFSALRTGSSIGSAPSASSSGQPRSGSATSSFQRLNRLATTGPSNAAPAPQTVSAPQGAGAIANTTTLGAVPGDTNSSLLSASTGAGGALPPFAALPQDNTKILGGRSAGVTSSSTSTSRAPSTPNSMSATVLAAMAGPAAMAAAAAQTAAAVTAPLTAVAGATLGAASPSSPKSQAKPALPPSVPELPPLDPKLVAAAVTSVVTVNFIDPTSTSSGASVGVSRQSSASSLASTASTTTATSSSVAAGSVSTASSPAATQPTVVGGLFQGRAKRGGLRMGAQPSPAPASGPSSFISPFTSASSTHHSTEPPQRNMPQDLYNKLVNVFARDYACTLNSVPYQNLRSGAKESIEKLLIRCSLTGRRTEADGSTDASSPWGGLSSAAPISDPAEWHLGPYCHVYIAACESMEHYRQRVRPALQAFVSQIEGSGASSALPTSEDGGRNDRHHHDGASQATAAAAAASSAASGNFSSQYLIVYVPVTPSGGAATAGSPPHAAGTAGGGTNVAGPLGGGFRAAMSSRFGTGGNRRGLGLIGVGSQGAQDDPMAAAPPPGPIMHTSKNEKEIHKRFTIDFPHGRTVIMSTLVDAAESPMSAAATSPLKNKEWGALLQALGNAIVSGFRDRVRRYDEELRRLDSRRANMRGNSASRSRGPRGSAQTSAAPAFDLSHFFLVKESLAFTYEQMQLPSEALLQYEELGAFLPEGRWVDDDDVVTRNGGLVVVGGSKNSTPSSSPARKSIKGSLAESSASLAELSTSGDFLGFRRRLRSVTDMAAIARFVLQYVYARETHLLFLMKRPVDIIRQSDRFVRAIYRMRLETAKKDRDRRLKKAFATERSDSSENMSQEDLEKRALRKFRETVAAAEAGAVDACWDVKVSCDNFFSFDTSAADLMTTTRRDTLLDLMGRAGRSGPPSLLRRGLSGGIPDPPSLSGSGPPPGVGSLSGIEKDSFPSAGAPPVGSLSGVSRGAGEAEEERDAACRLSELLEFARLRLLRLGDMDLLPTRGGQENGSSNPIRAITGSWPHDMKQAWIPWEEIVRSIEDKKENDLTELDEDELTPITQNPRNDSNFFQKLAGTWLEGSLDSASSFEDKYLELTSAIVALNNHAGRSRIGARLRGEQAEIYLRRQDYSRGARSLVPIVEGCTRDKWDRAHCWRLFRLAYAQRMIGNPVDYVKTLTGCFDARLASVTPPETALLLQRDLEAVVADRRVASTRLGVSPFLESELEVKRTSKGSSGDTVRYLRKDIETHFCLVGDRVSVSLTLTSHLPRPITVDSISLFILTSEQHESVHRGATFVTEADTFRILPFKSNVTLQPGRNQCECEWIPMTVGHYILASVEVRWNEACFVHDSSALPNPMIGIDVLPCDTRQTIELNPLFLIPGHVQQVRLVFEAGPDIVREGKVDFLCSPGLKVIPPGTEPSSTDDKLWSDFCSVPLQACSPNEKLTISTYVKSAAMGGIGARSKEGPVQRMKARVRTQYHHALYSEVTGFGKEPEADPMTAELEAYVTTLDRPALTVDKADAFPFGDNSIMMSVTLHCNTPLPFFLKEWDISLPPPFSVAEDGDLNAALFEHHVCEGEELFFGFKCIRARSFGADEHVHGDTRDLKAILNVVLQDELGKSFLQVLPLDLDEFYEEMRQEDEYAGKNNAIAELRCSREEGFVGAPVNFTYLVDIGSLKTTLGNYEAASPMSLSSSSLPPSLLFAITSDTSEWILSGKVRGTVDRNSDSNSFSIDFVGIPTRSGVLNRFPAVELQYFAPPEIASQRGLRGALPAIRVHCKHPESFQSLSYLNHMALACP